MSWYTVAANIETVQDRNDLNYTISRLEDIIGKLVVATELVYQTGSGARSLVQKLLADTKLSSYPRIRSMLADASRIALDSPSRFADIASQAADELGNRLGKLKDDRKTSVNKGLKNPQMPWVKVKKDE